MFLGHLIPGLPGEWIQSDRKGLAGGFLGQVLTPESSSAAGDPAPAEGTQLAKLLPAPITDAPCFLECLTGL